MLKASEGERKVMLSKQAIVLYLNIEGVLSPSLCLRAPLAFLKPSGFGLTGEGLQPPPQNLDSESNPLNDNIARTSYRSNVSWRSYFLFFLFFLVSSAGECVDVVLTVFVCSGDYMSSTATLWGGGGSRT